MRLCCKYVWTTTVSRHGSSCRTKRGAWDACAPPLPTSPKENAMSKYSVEEVRKAAALISSVYPDEREVFYMLTAYAERIKADEESAVGYVETDNKIVFYVEDGWSKEVPPGTKLFAHPPAQATSEAIEDAAGEPINHCNVCGQPVRYGERHSRCGEVIMAAVKAAQAAQVDKPPQLGGCCGGEPCTLGVVHRTDGPCFHYVEPTAEPVARDELTDRTAFERWLIGVHGYSPSDLIWQESRNCYADYGMHLAWKAWQDAAPPAQPAERVPEEATDELVPRWWDDSHGGAYKEGWNDCRAAMLAASPAPSEGGKGVNDKCPDCLGYGENCLAGRSAHPSNWYMCETCNGTGKKQAAR